jgi:spore coat protein U-like protein
LLRLPLALALLAATSNTGTVNVTGAIVADCSITTSTFGFGTYDPIVTNASAALNTFAQSLSVKCTRGATGVTISLDLGSNSTHAVNTTRAMSGGGGNYLSYELYTSNSYATVWNTTNTVSYAPTSFAATGITVYGQIPGAQDVSVATYSDSVTATVNF